MANPTEKIRQIHCNRCSRATKHLVLFSELQHHEELCFENGYSERNDYCVAKCKGCEHITFLVDSDSSDQGGTYTTQYPSQIIRKEPQWLIDLLMQDKMDNPFKYMFMKEIYIALRGDNFRLAVIGIRALLEQIMIEKIKDNGTFKKNLDKFETEGYLSKIQRKAIEPVLEAGHASMHRGFSPSKEDLIHLLNITENVIESIYINEMRSEKLNIPKRKKKDKKQSIQLFKRYNHRIYPLMYFFEGVQSPVSVETFHRAICSFQNSFKK